MNKKNVHQTYLIILTCCLFMLAACAGSSQPTYMSPNQITENDVFKVFMADAHGGNLDGVRLYVESGGDVNKKDPDHAYTALYFAASQGHTAILSYLLDNGASLNIQNKFKWTPLYVAADKGHTEVVKALLASGADVKPKDVDGYTALHAAASKGHAEIVKLLLANGADPNAKNNIGSTALDYAEQYPNVVKLLQDVTSVKAKSVKTTSVKATPASVSTFTHAAHAGKIDILKNYIKNGGDVNVQEGDGWSALHYAAMKGNIEIVKFLLANGADKSLKTKSGITALSLARGKHPEIEKLLK